MVPMARLDSLCRTRLSFIHESFGDPLSILELVETELPELLPGKLRVAVSHVPVNPSDLIPITGAYTHRITLPAVAGYEGVGCVVEAPPEFSHLLGQRVLPLRGEGTWQTQVDCPIDHVIQVPETIPDLTAARAYINPLAANMMLRNWPVRNKIVLLSGAGSNCAEYLGGWAIRQGAKRVIGIYRSESRRKRLHKLGIEPVAMLDPAGIAEAARQADIAFDALGGDIASHVLRQMRSDTYFVAYGLLTGKPVAAAAVTRPAYRRFHMRDHLAPLAGRGMHQAFAEIWPLLADAPPQNPEVFDARDWRKAIAEATRPAGRKPILDMSRLI